MKSVEVMSQCYVSVHLDSREIGCTGYLSAQIYPSFMSGWICNMSDSCFESGKAE